MSDAADFTPVQIEPDQEEPRLGVVRLNRPPVNALSQDMWDDLHEIAASLHSSSSPYRAVVITGTGRHFAAGADITSLVNLSVDEFDRRNRVLQRAFHLIASAPQVTIAAVNGYALGGGCELALAADLRIGGHRTVIGLPEVTLGIMPGSGGTQRLAATIGLGRAKELILSGRQVTASEAHTIGLLNEVADDDDVVTSALRIGRQYAVGPAALRHAKRAVDASVDLSIEEGLELEARAIVACFATADARIGLRSFVAHGPGPVSFTGR